MIVSPTIAARTALTLILLVGANMPAASGDKIEVANVDVIIQDNPLPPGGATASIVASIRANDAEIGVLVMSKNRLHHHDHQDHVLYLVRGDGTARLENATGQIETRSIKPGDILSLPRGRKHGFEKTGSDDLVFLVIATALPSGIEETTYDD